MTNIEKQLKNLGLNSYEVKIWSALLSNGNSTAGELSEIANVPRSRSYDVLESLQNKGFITIKQDKPMSYLAVPPNQVIESVKKRIQQEAKLEVKKLNNLKYSSTITELNNLHLNGAEMVDPADHSGSLKGKHNLYNHLEHMISNSQKNIFITTTQKEFIEIIFKFKGIFEKLNKKNININILTQITPETEKFVKQMKGVANIKHTESKARFCIVDNKEIVMMILDDDEVNPSYDVGIWVNTPFASELTKIHGYN